MEDANLHIEAETCRQKAALYSGKPEALFLLRVAREFDRLEAEKVSRCSKTISMHVPKK
jgi:hypothetical protein